MAHVAFRRRTVTATTASSTVYTFRRDPIDELPAVPLPLGGGLLVLGLNPLAIGVDLPVVPDQPNPVSEGGARDRERKLLDVAHVDEGVRVALEVRVDPVPSAEPLRGRQIVREPEGDVDVGRLVGVAADSRAEQNREADVRLREIPPNRRHVHALDGRFPVVRSRRAVDRCGGGQSRLVAGEGSPSPTRTTIMNAIILSPA